MLAVFLPETYMTSHPKNGGFPSSESPEFFHFQVLLLLVSVSGRVLGGIVWSCAGGSGPRTDGDVVNNPGDRCCPLSVGF